jgi:hypothetical protein
MEGEHSSRLLSSHGLSRSRDIGEALSNRYLDRSKFTEGIFGGQRIQQRLRQWIFVRADQSCFGSV